MSYSTDLTDEQWALLEPVFNAPGKRGPKHAPDLRRVVDAMLYVSHTGLSGGTSPSRSGRVRGVVTVPPLVSQRHLVTGLPIGPLVVPVSTHENRASQLTLEHLILQGVTGRLELVLVDRGVTAAAA